MGVTCENLVIGRGDFRVAANWSLPAGASLALIGPSGAGKSLFLNALAGFETIHAGRILMDGQDVTETGPAHRPLTLMFQDHNLFPHLTVTQNIGLGLDPGLRLSPEDQTRITMALDQVELAGFGGRYPDALSGGQQSRVALARALIRQKPLLLLDEPFAALGPGLRRDMLARVAAIRAAHDMPLIFVSHAPEDARSADLTAFVHGGVISAPVDTNALFADPPAALRAYL